MDSVSLKRPCGQGEKRPARRHSWLKILSIVTGFASLVWFLLRVIPKPSRATYPCQRAAAPLASGFIIWLSGLIGAKALYRKSRVLIRQKWYAVVALILALVVYALWLPLGVMDEADAQQQKLNAQADPFKPSEPANAPIGGGKGINPGRVVWAYDPDATSWDGTTGNWWDDANTNQRIVDDMVSKSLTALTGKKTDKKAWDALFRYFNQAGKSGGAGYRRGEKVAIKINANQDRSPEWGKGERPLNGLPSPHLVYALVNQLITVAGVPGEDITIYEAADGRNIGKPVFDKIRAGSNADFKAVRFVANKHYDLQGRLMPSPDKDNPIHFADAAVPTAYLPSAVTEAKYLINVALFRSHTLCGVTLCAKNHFGSVYFPDHGGWTPRPMHEFVLRNRPMGSYNALVDLIGHRHLGGKTLLYMIDGLYSAEHNEGNVMRLASFGDDWASSLFLSQDPVAIDSVGLDFLRNEPKADNVRGFPDNYMHEAALADKPPSGVKYDPEGDGTPLKSLGVHEHWNNPTDKQYSRNLKKGEGIELVTLSKAARNLAQTKGTDSK